jgi:hypothetical protein
MNLKELLDTVDAPETHVAEGAWDIGRARLRRRRTVASLVAAGTAVVTVGGVALVSGQTQDGSGRHQQPAGSDSAQVVVTKPDWEVLKTAERLGPGTDSIPLSANPVQHASLVLADPGDDAGAFILGDDGVWRRLDVAGLTAVKGPSGNKAPIIGPTSLNRDATRLAIPQPDGLVVVDLTSGSSEHFDVPGRNVEVKWQDTDHVLVLGPVSTLVDLDSGSSEVSEYGFGTRLLPDGSAVTWGGGLGNERYRDSLIRWSDGREIQSPANNAGGLFSTPLVQENVVVGVHRMGMSMSTPWVSTGDTGLDALMRETNGVVAVDASDGDVRGYLKLSTDLVEPTSLLGWLGDLPVLGLTETGRDAYDHPASHLVVWDFRSGTLTPLGVVPTWYVSWGTGVS